MSPFATNQPAPSSAVPRITVVTPSMNQAEFIEETIRSVLDQGYANLEYVVIDGGSSDGSVDVIRKYEKRLAYWTSERDHGQADAINKGWRRATGDILTYLNSDDTYFPGALRLAAETLARDPAVAFVYGRCKVIDEHGTVLRERRVRAASFPELLRWSPSIPQPSMFLRRTAVESVGFLNPNLHFTMDYELALRIGLKYKIQFIPHLLANMRDHAAAKTALDPLKHVEEGINVAECFFQQTLPDNIAALNDRTLATLNIRKARVLSRLGRGAEARTIIASAFERCPDVRGEAIQAWVMSLLGANAVAGLRRIKRAWLRRLV
jgi:glycosyltransferase involved in cell wall biosynthesis